MSAKLRIGITQRVDELVSRLEVRDALDQKLVSLISSLGFYPIPVPNSIINEGEHKLFDWLEEMQINGIIISGGNDINDFPARDQTELSILSWSEINKIPVLGLCRGMQLIATYFGGKLEKVDGHVASTNNVKVISLDGEWPESITCYHNLRIEDCPLNFEVAVLSNDGTIEAIISPALGWEAWMWHPEREDTFRSVDLERIKKLFNGN